MFKLKIFLCTLVLGVLCEGALTGSEVFNLNQIKSGNMQWSPAVPCQLLRLRRSKIPTAEIAVTPQKELRFALKPGQKKGAFDVRLNFPRQKKFVLEFALKGENFFLKKVSKNFFNFNVGGVFFLVRGDRQDLRYYDGKARRYIRFATINDGEYCRVKIAITCGEPGSFSINNSDKLVPRQKCNLARYLNFSGNFSTFGGAPTILIKDLKITTLP